MEKDPDKVTADGLRVDMILEDADIINLGDEKIAAFWNKGHTDCSVSYFMQPGRHSFASESTGIIGIDGKVRTSILKKL